MTPKPKNPLLEDTDVYRGLKTVAVTIGSIIVLLGAGRWLVGIEFIDRQAFAAYQKEDQVQNKKVSEALSQIRDYMLWDCAYKAAGDGAIFDNCRKMLAPEKP